MRPRPTPPTPPKPDESTDFSRPLNFELRSGGPRDFARLTKGSRQIGGESRVVKPEPNGNVG